MLVWLTVVLAIKNGIGSKIRMKIRVCFIIDDWVEIERVFLAIEPQCLHLALLVNLEDSHSLHKLSF